MLMIVAATGCIVILGVLVSIKQLSLRKIEECSYAEGNHRIPEWLEKSINFWSNSFKITVALCLVWLLTIAAWITLNSR